jgi:hypothetical protein
MISPKYLDVAELAERTNQTQDSIIELCCLDRIPYLGVPIDPIFKADELHQLIEIIQQKGGLK